MKQKKWYVALVAMLMAVMLCFAVGCGELREAVCGRYAIKLIEENDFYNPSSVRVLRAYYQEDPENEYVSVFECEAIVFCQIQAGTKAGGTTTMRYAVLIGGERDGEALGCKEDDFSGDPLDVGKINEILKDH